ncbi:hypothetical protein PA598K_01368 [Paenibacillus sp. 598K]|uniref:hypothetical protein n=1 Tax=Paenibacillus sp. 598K TaxID=1117987 RepID=UPI000FFA1612|nr:hypothetical protein [Paenibacillus sp. 598K]GBF73083.1 hypothetical protein PA598K_01368 [Paenibacillus sp. 598K]
MSVLKELKKVDSIEEANALLENGWRLMESGHVIKEGEAQFFFLLGRHESYADIGKKFEAMSKV